MEITRLADLRPRFVWDIVDDAFDLYRENFALLCGISACVMVPAGVLTVALVTSTVGRAASAKADSTEVFGYLGSYLLVTLPLAFAARAVEAGATAAAVEARLNGQSITLAQAYKHVGDRFWSIAGAFLVSGLAVLAGSCALGVGAVFAAIWLAFVPQAIIVEKRGLWSAVGRAKRLADGNMLKVFGVMVLIGFVSYFLAEGLEVLIEGVFGLLPSHSAALTAQKTILAQSATSLVQVVLEPLQTIALTLLYFDLRVRREGMDIVAAAQEHGVTLAPDPFGDVNSEAISRQSGRRGTPPQGLR